MEKFSGYFIADEEGHGSNLKRQLTYGSLGSLLLNIALHLLNFLTAVCLARIMGPESFGLYVFCISIVQIVKIPAGLGGAQIFVREVAAYRTGARWGLIRGLLKRSFQAILVVSAVTIFIAFSMSTVLGGNASQILLYTFWISLFLVPLLALLESRSGVLRGLHYVLLSQIPSLVVRPLCVIGFVVLWYALTRNPLTPQMAMICQVAATGTALGMIMILLSRCLPADARKCPAEYDTSAWLKSTWPLMLILLLQMLLQQSSIFFLGVLQEASSVGIYRVAQRGAGLTLFGLIGVNMALAPTLSRLYAEREMKRLQQVLITSARMAIFFSVVLTLVLIVFGSWIIPVVFGPAYAPAYLPLVILCAGHFLNVSMGSVGLALIMTGNERGSFAGVAIGALVSVFLNMMLIPIWGVSGAAAAFSISLLICNIIMAVYLYRKTRLISTPLMFMKKQF